MNWKGMGKHKTLGGLGYRELESFNLAFQYPDSLVAKVFQEKYYAGGNFLES